MPLTNLLLREFFEAPYGSETVQRLAPAVAKLRVPHRNAAPFIRNDKREFLHTPCAKTR